jgi:hypothetical protein
MSVNVISTSSTVKDTTQKYLDNEYRYTAPISEDVYLVVIAYFESIAFGNAAAKNLAGAFIDACNADDKDPIVTLQELKQMPDSVQNNVILFLLNSVRVGTSLLGSPINISPNKYALRQVVF